jgi:hypothetical protein
MNWKPIEEFDKEKMHRIPVMVYDPTWYCREWPKSNIAQAYWDKYLDGGSWYIVLFEYCSSFAWVTYHSASFKPEYFAEIPDFKLP